MPEMKNRTAYERKIDTQVRKENLALWDSVAQTDPDFTKPVAFGSRKFTNIDAYYQIRLATEMFGPLGHGWGYTVDSVVFDPAGEYMFAYVSLWYVYDGKKSHPFTVLGGSACKGKGGDEAGKKAVTDALGKALSYLGFNADVYMGKFDDSKYVESLKSAKDVKEFGATMFKELEGCKNDAEIDGVVKKYKAEIARIERSNPTALDAVKDQVSIHRQRVKGGKDGEASQ